MIGSDLAGAWVTHGGIAVAALKRHCRPVLDGPAGSVTHGGIAVAALKLLDLVNQVEGVQVTHGGIAVAALKAEMFPPGGEFRGRSPTAASPWPR